MADWHLYELENNLNKIGWRIKQRLDSNKKNKFLGGWIIIRGSERLLEFEGIIDSEGKIIKSPSIVKAYGCIVKETSLNLYFYKKGEKWNESLKFFINQLNEIN